MPPCSQDGVHRLSVQDDVEPDSLSDASKSDDGSVVERGGGPPSDAGDKDSQRKARHAAKPTSFYIGSGGAAPKLERPVSKSSTAEPARTPLTKTFSSATLTKARANQEAGKVRPNASAPVISRGPESKEGSVASLIRQESFTKERPSNDRLPNISSLPPKRPNTDSFQGSFPQDTHSYLKQTEDVLAALEAKLQAAPSPVTDSLSGESDVDTASTVSQQSSKAKPITPPSKTFAGGINRETSSGSLASQDSNRQSAEKHHSQGADFSNKPEPVRRTGHGAGRDEPQSFPCSDQESNHRKKHTAPLQKEDGKTSRSSQALSRTNSLSAPRPTRASMLRRARLGEASDNEGTEAERSSQEAAKQPQEARKLSRLDMLAMPRKRTSSFNTPSDSEASSAPQWSGRTAGFSNLSGELGSSSVRRASAPKPADRPQKAALNKLPVARMRSASAKYANSTASEYNTHEAVTT